MYSFFIVKRFIVIVINIVGVYISVSIGDYLEDIMIILGFDIIIGGLKFLVFFFL